MQATHSIARPYALAVFRLAQESDSAEQWAQMLDFLALVMRDPQMAGLVANPRVNREQLAAMVTDIGGERLDDVGRNFVRLLTEKRRLGVLPEIARLYAEERARAERRSTVKVTAAFELDDKQRAGLNAAMTERLGTDVDLQVDVDKGLIGGVVIRSGDLVIDASLKGRLKQLERTLAGRASS